MMMQVWILLWEGILDNLFYSKHLYVNNEHYFHKVLIGNGKI